MSDTSLIVITFDREDEASQVLRSIRGVEHAGQMHLDDTAVIVKGADGKVHVKNELSSGTEYGAVGGGLLGLLLGSVFFPLAGLAVGVIGGALVGRMLDDGVDRRFVKDVSESLRPGMSALFITASGGSPDAIVAALEPYRGTLYQTNLSYELEQSMKDALARGE